MLGLHYRGPSRLRHRLQPDLQFAGEPAGVPGALPEEGAGQNSSAHVDIFLPRYYYIHNDPAMTWTHLLTRAGLCSAIILLSHTRNV